MRKSSPVPDNPSISPELHCSVEDQRRILGASTYFNALDANALAQIQQHFKERHFPTGATIHLAGDPARWLSIVAMGVVKLYRPTPEGIDVTLDFITAGDHFGTLDQLGDTVYRYTAVAQTDCCILSTTSQEFSEVLAQYPGVALASLNIVAARLRAAQSTIEELSAYPVEQRVAIKLVHLSRKMGTPVEDGVLINMPLSRQDLADLTGTTVETVSRVMSAFRRDGLVDSGRQWTVVRDVAALEDRAT